MRKPAFSKVFRYFELKPVKNPRRRSDFSGVVLVKSEAIKGYCNISFSDNFVEKVAKLAVFGINSCYPVYLAAFHLKSNNKWQISAVYLHSKHEILLWEVDVFPKWLGKVHSMQK